MTAEKAHIYVGAIWRRRKTGALVRIAALKNRASPWNPQPYYDISWETVEKPTRRGVSYEDYWFKNCEPVTLPGEGSNLMSDHNAENDRNLRTALAAARVSVTDFDAILAAAREGMAQAWDEGYVAGNAFGYEWAQDTYDGPVEDPTENPYRSNPPGSEADRG